MFIVVIAKIKLHRCRKTGTTNYNGYIMYIHYICTSIRYSAQEDIDFRGNIHFEGKFIKVIIKLR